jgi:UDP-N-acetylglucosamine 2-epimerase (non-hydrolysing)
MMVKVINVVDSKRSLLDIAPIVATIRQQGETVTQLIVQIESYPDDAADDLMLNGLKTPKSNIDLRGGIGTHTTQTALTMLAFESVLIAQQPDWVLMAGQSDAALACTLTARKRCFPVARIGAGRRTNDRTMPAEINRRLIDQLADLLFTSSQECEAQLQREGLSSDRILSVGNVRVDLLLKQLHQAELSAVLDKHVLRPGCYAVLTIQEPENVENPAALRRIMVALKDISDELPVIFPVTSRVRARLTQFDIKFPAQVRLVEPLNFYDFLRLWTDARLVITDCDWLEEETTALGVPCLTLREQTESPVTVSQGTNYLVGNDPAQIVGTAFEILGTLRDEHRCLPAMWDGHAAERLVATLVSRTNDFARPADRLSLPAEVIPTRLQQRFAETMP